MSVIKMMPLISESRSILTEDSTGSKLIDTILKKSEPLIKDMLAAAESYQIKQFNQPFSKFDESYFRLMFTYELINAIEKYTLPTDKLVKFKADSSKKGNVQIAATIERDGNQYPLTTDVIYAGGHNIQRLHFRYLTKTSLPKQSATPVSAVYKDKMKRMSKIEKIQEEIRLADARIRHNEEVLAAAEEVLKRPDADAEIVRLQTVVELKRNKREVTSSANYLITSWKRENIENPKLWIDSAKKYKQTMQAKIDAAIK
jgi:hypothetical protein